MKKRLVVALTGSSGAVLGIRLLQALQGSEVETHLVVSPSARLTIEQETRWKLADVQALAAVNYPFQDVGAAIASGSFATSGMVVIPCSVKTLSAVANSYADNLITRAADVTLKEGRPLVLVVRETPLHAGHLRLMKQAARAGAVIFPPVPAFYARPQSIDEMVDHTVGRVLERLGIETGAFTPWEGLQKRDPAAWPPPELLALPHMTLATLGSTEGRPIGGTEGRPSTAGSGPHAANLYFAAGEGLRLYFFSTPESQHGADLAVDARCAVTIAPLAHGWEGIFGLQLRGEAHPVPSGAEWETAWQAYRNKFPFVAGLKDVIAANALYVFVPEWARLVDNQQGFGFKEERQFP